MFSGVTVLVVAPDPESVEAHAVGAETFDHPVEPASALKSEDPKTVGESWEVSTDPNVAKYGKYKCKLNDSYEDHSVGVGTLDHPVEPASALKSEDPKTVGEFWKVSTDPNVAKYGEYEYKLNDSY